MILDIERRGRYITHCLMSPELAHEKQPVAHDDAVNHHSCCMFMPRINDEMKSFALIPMVHNLSASLTS